MSDTTSQIDPEVDALFAARFGDSASPAGAEGEVGSSPPGLPADLPPVDETAGGTDEAPDGLTDTEVPETIDAGTAPPAELAPEGGGDAVEPPPPSPTPEPQTSFDANAMFREFLGHDLDAPQGESLLRLYADLSTLAQTDPQRAAYIDALLYGGADLPGATQTLAPPITPPAAPVPSPVAPQVDEWGEPLAQQLPPQMDPAVLARIEAMEANAAAEAQRRDQELAAQNAQWQQWAVGEMDKGARQFIADAPVAYTDEQMVVLKAKAERSGLFPAFHQATGGNPLEAERMLLNHIVQEDPVEKQRWREAEIAAEIKRRDEDARRQQRASSVSAGGNSGGGQTPVDPTKMTRAELIEAGQADARRMISGEAT